MKNKKLKYSPFGKLFRRIRIGLLRLYRSTDSPNQIAFGFSFGAFIGIFPTFGFGLLLCAGLGKIFKFNIPASILGSLVGIPWLTPFWFVSSILLGNAITDSIPDELTFSIFIDNVKEVGTEYFLKLGVDYTFAYVVGNVILSVVISAILYLIVRKMVISYRTKKQENMSKSNHIILL